MIEKALLTSFGQHFSSWHEGRIAATFQVLTTYKHLAVNQDSLPKQSLLKTQIIAQYRRINIVQPAPFG